MRTGVMPIDYSIIVCTARLSSALELTLSSITDSCAETSAVGEVVVVENGEGLRSSQFRDHKQGSKLPFRYLMQPQIGKGFAYNTGIAASRGRILLFTDDDVRVPRNWIVG